MSRPIWFVNLIKKSFPTRFALARFTRAPLIGRLIDHAFFDGDDIIYLPRDNLIQDNLLQVNEPIERPADIALPSAVVAHFIEQAEYHWIMDFCLCRESDHCHDYPRELGCIFLGEAVLKINPKLGRLATRQEALNHLRRCQEAGLVHMIGRNKLDTIWLGATPGKQLLPICNCCPCCCLWKIIPDLNPIISSKVTKMPGIEELVSELSEEKNIEFVMLSVDRNEAAAHKYMRRYKFEFPSYTMGGPLTNQLRVPSLPTTFVISPEGEIIKKKVGIQVLYQLLQI